MDRNRPRWTGTCTEPLTIGSALASLGVFVQTEAPDASKIPPTDMLGVTVLLVTCSYKTQEFIRVGYYVNNTYADPIPEGAPSHQVDCRRHLLLPIPCCAFMIPSPKLYANNACLCRRGDAQGIGYRQN